MKILVMFAAVFVSGALLVPTLANARQQDDAQLEKVTATIRYNPQELKTDEGIARLQSSVNAKIRWMCWRGRESKPELYRDSQRCVADAREAIAPQLDSIVQSASNR